MIFDSHLHLGIMGSGNKEKVVQTLFDDMKRARVDKTCLMPDPPGYLYFSREDMLEQAETLSRMGEKYEGILYPLLWINPNLPFDFLKPLIDHYILNGHIIGVKFWIETNARDPRMELLAGYLEKHDIPVLFHCWYKTVQRYYGESDPSDMAIFARKYPSLRILMAHLTGCKFRGVQDIKTCSNVYVDTSSSQPEDGYLAYALQELGADRILYGSDYSGRDMATQIGRIHSIEMSHEDRDKIFCGNALKFFKRGERDA